MILLDWPADAFQVASEDWRLEGRTISTGGVFGPGTVIHVENRVWRVTVDLNPLYEAQAQPLRAMFDELRGQYGVVRVPVYQPPSQAVGLTAAGFDAGVTFDGGVAWGIETLSNITVAEATAAGATLLRLSVAPTLLKAGAMFSLPGDRLHRVTASVGARVRINPPLRSAVNVGDTVELAAPKARMRLTEDGAGLVRTASRMTAPRSFDLVEAF